MLCHNKHIFEKVKKNQLKKEQLSVFLASSPDILPNL